jgi:hypothetical protein
MKGEFIGILGQNLRWELGNINTYKMGLPFDIPLTVDDINNCQKIADSALFNHKMDSIKEFSTYNAADFPEKESWFRSSLYAKEIFRKPHKQQDIMTEGSSISGAGMRVYNRLRAFELAESQSFGLPKIKSKSSFPGLPAILPSISNISP